MRTVSDTVTTTGGAGVAAGTTSLGIGEAANLVGVVLHYSGQPGTTDVTISNWGRTLVTRTNSTTDTLVQPVTQVVTGAGADPGAGESERWVTPVVHGHVDVAVAQGDPAGTVTVVLLLES